MLLNYHICHVFLGSLCVGDFVRLGLSSVRIADWSTTGHYSNPAAHNTTCASAYNMDTTPAQPHRNSNTHRTKNNTTNVVIQQNGRKLLMMNILMSETC